MDKIFWIEEGRLAGRCGPSVSPFDFDAMKRAGIRYILSLAEDEYALIEGKDPDMEMKLIHFPNSIPPPKDEIVVFRQYMPSAIAYVREIIERNDGALVVHCHAGCDRTGGVLSGYIAHTRGIRPREALIEVRKANPRAISADGYEDMLMELLETWY